MRWLGRLPLWAWFTFSLFYVYALYNPFFGITEFMALPNITVSSKIIIGILFAAVGALYFVEGRNSLSLLGVALLLALIGAILFGAYEHGATFAYIHWWGQIIIAAILTLTLRWGQIYRELTGRVPVTPQHEHDDNTHDVTRTT